MEYSLLLPFLFLGKFDERRKIMTDKSVDKGTELEKIAEANAIQDEVFSEAFDIAEKGIGDKAEGNQADDSDTKKKDDKKADNQDADQHQEDKGADTADKKDKSADVKVKADAAADKSSDDKKDDDATYEQKWKSLNGILKSTETKFKNEIAQVTAERDTLKKTVEDLSKKKEDKKDADKDSEPEDNLTAEQKALLAQYDTEFDTVSKMEGIKREKELKKLEKKIRADYDKRIEDLQTRLDSKVKPIEESLQKTDENEHFKFIKSGHPDFEIYRDDGSILTWIETKPKYLQDALKKTYNEGLAADVVELITDFKRENNLLEDKNKNQHSDDADDKTDNKDVIDLNKKRQEQKDKKKQDLTTVSTKRGAVNVAHASASDFDSAWDEAVKK
jgi:hypothetical protein